MVDWVRDGGRSEDELGCSRVHPLEERGRWVVGVI
jgi:hypothetical protein